MSYILYFSGITLLIYWITSSTRFFSNPLITRRNSAEDLEEWLRKFNWGVRHDLTVVRQLPLYKFYTEIIEVLLQLARKMGGNYQESFLFLREGLQYDHQFEKKIKEVLNGTWFQMGTMFLLTWMFIICTLSLVDVQVSLLTLMLILLWQLLGMVCLPFFAKWLRKKLFGDIGKIWKMLYILKSLSAVPLSRSEVFTLAQVTELEKIYQKSLSSIVSKLKKICEKSLKVGGSYDGEIKYLMDELRFQEKWHFELFSKRLMAVKLALLAIFFLPSYLAFIFVVLGEMITQM